MTQDLSSVDQRLAHDVLHQAAVANDAARAASQALEEVFTAAMRAVLKVGDVIDVQMRRDLPEYLWNVKTMRGNDRGTKRFRVAEAPQVRVDLGMPSLSSWVCEMVPISEKTGQDMHGGAHGANNAGRTTVQIKGHLIDPHRSAILEDLDGPSDAERLVRFVDQARGMHA